MALVFRIFDLFRIVFFSLRDLFFPPVCVCCGFVLLDGEHTLCTGCRGDMPLTGYYDLSDNYFVGLFSSRVDFVTGSSLMFFRKGSDYRTMLHRMKYSGRSDIAYVLGLIYGGYLHSSGLYSGVELVVPVPLHWTRRISRGYNQSAEFARGISESMGVLCELGLLRRGRKTRTQARLRSLDARVSNVHDAFEILSPERFVSSGILLVDDIVTTGSTMEYCAQQINSHLPSARLYLGSIAVVCDM